MTHDFYRQYLSEKRKNRQAIKTGKVFGLNEALNTINAKIDEIALISEFSKLKEIVYATQKLKEVVTSIQHEIRKETHNC